MGVQDLRNCSFKKEDKIMIGGEWEFHWMRLLHPGDFTTVKNRGWIEFPEIWKNQQKNSKKRYRNGYATLRLRVLLPEDSPEILDLHMQSVYSACRVFINSKEICHIGQVGMNKNEEQPKVATPHLFFPVTSEQVEIIIHISNFHSACFGSWGPFYLGYPESLINFDKRDAVIKFCYFGFVLCAGLISLLFYIMLPTEKSMLFFSLFCLLNALNSVLHDQLTLFKLIPLLSDLNILFPRFLLWSKSILLGLFFYCLYPKEFSIKIISLIVILYIFYSFVNWFILSQTTYLEDELFIVIIIIKLLYIIISLIRAIIKKRKGTFIFLLSLINILIIYSLNLFIDNNFLSPITLTLTSMTLLIGSNLIYLSQVFTRSYTTFKTNKEEAINRKQSFIKSFKLSTRENEILEYILKGKGAKEIAAIYTVSPRTVETHTYNIFRKMGVHSRLEIISLFHDFSE